MFLKKKPDIQIIQPTPARKIPVDRTTEHDTASFFFHDGDDSRASQPPSTSRATDLMH